MGQSHCHKSFPLPDEQCEIPRMGVQWLFGASKHDDWNVSTSLLAQHIGQRFLGNWKHTLVNKTESVTRPPPLHQWPFSTVFYGNSEHLPKIFTQLSFGALCKFVILSQPSLGNVILLIRSRVLRRSWVWFIKHHLILPRAATGLGRLHTA